MHVFCFLLILQTVMQILWWKWALKVANTDKHLYTCVVWDSYAWVLWYVKGKVVPVLN